MPITLGANIASLTAQRSVDRASALTNKSLIRLSSGLRINSASDDAAGMSVSMTLAAKQRIFSRAHQNIQDGLSALQIVEGTLSSTSDVLARMSELAQQAANGALSYSQRQGLSREYQQLDQELRRMSRSTSFNGIDLLQGQRQVMNVSSTALSGAALALVGSSGDGRFAATRTAGSGVVLHDRDSGTSTVIDASATAGATLAMASNGDVVYGRSNELYYYSRHSGTSQQITAALGAEVYNGLTVSSDGRTVVFTSATKYVDGGTVNSSGSSYSAGTYTYALNTETGIIRRVSTTANALGIKVSEDGSKVAFYTDQGAMGQFVSMVDMSGSAALERFVANPDIIGLPPVIAGVSNAGNLYFASITDLTGQNPSGYQQIFKYAWGSNQLSQVTNSTDGGLFSSGIMSADESAIYWVGDSNMSGQNPDLDTQAFRLDVSSGSVFQITANNSNFSTSIGPMISRDGSRVAYTFGATVYFTSTTSGGSNFDIETGTGTAGVVSTAIAAFEGTIRGLSGFSLTTRSSALGALEAIQASQRNLGNMQGVIGAASSRLLAAGNVSAELAFQSGAAKSRITDIDVAEESAAFIRTSILREAGTAILAQANQTPQLALMLLGI